MWVDGRARGKKGGSVSGHGHHRWDRVGEAGSRGKEGVTDAERPPQRGPSLLVPESDHSGGRPGGLGSAGGGNDSDTGRPATWRGQAAPWCLAGLICQSSGDEEWQP